jgi:hypothetical protein
MKPAGWERPIDSKLLGNLEILSAGKDVCMVFRIIMKAQKDRFGLFWSTFPNEPPSCNLISFLLVISGPLYDKKLTTFGNPVQPAQQNKRPEALNGEGNPLASS